MKSLASVTDIDIETIKMALNDSISDMTSELKKELRSEKKNSLTYYKERYLRVFDKLKANGSIYALTETDLDIVAGGLNDAIELIEDNLTDDLAEEENEERTACEGKNGGSKFAIGCQCCQEIHKEEYGAFGFNSGRNNWIG